MRTTILNILIIQIILAGWNISCFGQDVPYLKLFDYKLKTSLSADIEATAEFRLPYEQIDDYLQYKQEYTRLKELFEEEAEDLENEYNASYGERKIQNGKALIELVIEYEGLIQALKVPYLNRFQGDQNIKITLNNSYINMSGNSTGFGNLILSQMIPAASSIPMGFPLKVTGTVTGESDFTMDMPMLNMHANGDNQFNDTVKGILVDTIFYCNQKGFITEGTSSIHGETSGFFYMDGEIKIKDNKTTGEIVLAIPFALVTMSIDGSTVKGDSYLYDDELNFYHISNTNSPHEHQDIYQYYKLEFVDPVLEKIPFQKLKDKYFKYYVISLNSERNHKYYSTDDLADRKSTALETLQEMLKALILGRSISISSDVYIELMLVLKLHNSLFDVWFNLAFTSQDNFIVHMTSEASSPEVKVAWLDQRIKNSIKYFYEGKSIASDQLLHSLGLYYKSPFFDNIFKDYFTPANTLQCSLLNDEAIGAVEYTRWIKGVYRSSQILCNLHISNLILSLSCREL